MRLHEDEKVGITKTLTEHIGAVLKTRLIEEELTIHTVTAPLVSYKAVNITKLKQDLKKHKKQVNGEFQRNMESSLLAYDPLTRRQILSGIHRKVKRMKSGVDKELKALRLEDRICKMCEKTRLDCRCKEEIVENAKRQDQCLVCLQFHSRGLLPLQPCGHRVVCDRCLHDRPLLRKCPLSYCRRDILKNKCPRLLQEDYRSKHAIKKNNKFLSLVHDWKK
eukprot:g4798.t1